MVIHSRRKAVRTSVAPKQPEPQPIAEKEPQPQPQLIIEEQEKTITKHSVSKKAKKILEEIEQEVKEQE